MKKQQMLNIMYIMSLLGVCVWGGGERISTKVTMVAA